MDDTDRFKERYQLGEWRAQIFRDLILEDARSMTEKIRDELSNETPRKPLLLDIGCGSGFDDSERIQAQLAEASRKYVGVEPDAEIELASCIDECHRSLFEDAQIEENSVDLAFSVMVLEHVSDPPRFWNKIHQVLRPGGVFWGFTVDRRHLFAHVSTLLERLKLKDLYLEKMCGQENEEVYENYPTCYLANSPAQIRSSTMDMFDTHFINFSKIGQVDYYVPRLLRPVAHAADRLQMSCRLPGSILAVRLEKRPPV